MTARPIIYGILSAFLLCTLITSYSLAETDDSWAYSENIFVTENAGQNLTDYQVNVILDSSNFNFSRANTDGSDLRFFEGEKELDYWIENWNSEEKEASVWVKISSLSANKEKIILMKYGNPEAVSASSGDDTFEFFDDFTLGYLNSRDWKTESDGEGFVNISHGECKLTVPKTHPHDFVLIYTQDSFDINSMFMVKRMKVTTGKDERGPSLRQGLIDQIDNTKNEIKHETELANETRVLWELSSRKANTRTLDLTNVGVPEGEWYTSGIAWYEEDDNRTVSWFKNGVRDPKMDYTSTEYVSNLPMHLYLYAASASDASDNTGYMAVDYALVRKFVPTEPSVSFASAPSETEPATENETEVETGEENATENVSETESENVSVSLPEEEETSSEAVFPEYSVNASGIRLSSPYNFNFSSMVNELKSSSIGIVFLDLNTTDVWQYERFVKSAHEKGLKVYAVVLKDPNCSGEWDLNSSLAAVDTVLEYNEKSLGDFDGLTIYMEQSSDSASEEGCMDYVSLLEAVSEKTEGKITLCASLPPVYSASDIEEIAPFVDFFIVRAYGGETENLNSMDSILDAVASHMGEIRGADSKSLIEVSIDEGFNDKMAVQECFASLENYYSGDPTFYGVSISDYTGYTALPIKAEATEEETEKSSIPGFGLLSVILAGTGAFAFLQIRIKNKGEK